MEVILEQINGFIWGAPALLLILGVGLYLTLRTGFVQIRLLPEALGRFWRMLFGGGSSFRCLCTALGATVGTGNLIGVAGAICLGGPGSIFWMWICGFLGMGTKYAETVLALRYRKRAGEEYLGGPMYVIEGGLGKKWRWMGTLYALFGLVAAFGVGNATQVSALMSGIHGLTGNGSQWGDLLLGLGIGLLVWRLLSGGAGGIGNAAERLVPLAAGGYILLCVLVLIARYDRVGAAFQAIFLGAFSPKAVTGGAVGSAFSALRVGCARGVFTNEAGMGTASMAHAGAEAEHPAQQGMMGIVEVFLDTIVICTLTALVILCSGVPIPYGTEGLELTADAFGAVCGDWVRLFLTGALACFAVATILGWGLYGLRCAGYLFGPGSVRYFALAQGAAAVWGAVGGAGAIWLLAEVVNGLMAIPNLLALGLLSRQVQSLTREYRPRKQRRLAIFRRLWYNQPLSQKKVHSHEMV